MITLLICANILRGAQHLPCLCIYRFVGALFLVMCVHDLYCDGGRNVQLRAKEDVESREAGDSAETSLDGHLITKQVGVGGPLGHDVHLVEGQGLDAFNAGGRDTCRQRYWLEDVILSHSAHCYEVDVDD